MNRLLLAAPLIVIALLLGVFGYALFNPDPGGSDPLVGRALPSLPLSDFPGAKADFDPEAVEGPYLLNFWASYCPGCRIEHPLLVNLSEQGVPIMGVVHKDDPEDVYTFLARTGDPFAALADDPEGRAALDVGLTGTPETFVIDAEGVIRARWRGAVSDIVWIEHLEPAWRAAGGVEIDASQLPRIN